MAIFLYIPSLASDPTTDVLDTAINNLGDQYHNGAESKELNTDPAVLSQINSSANGYMDYAGLVNGRGSWSRGSNSNSWDGANWVETDGLQTWPHPDDTPLPKTEGWGAGSLGSAAITLGYNELKVDGSTGDYRPIGIEELDTHYGENGAYNDWLHQTDGKSGQYDKHDTYEYGESFIPSQWTLLANNYDGTDSGATNPANGNYVTNPTTGGVVWNPYLEI